MFKKVGILALILSAGMTILEPSTAQAADRHDRDGYHDRRDRDGYHDRRDHRDWDRNRDHDRGWRRHEWREHERWDRRHDRGYLYFNFSPAPRYYYTPAPRYGYQYNAYPYTSCPY